MPHGSVAEPVIDLPEPLAPLDRIEPNGDHDGVRLASVDLGGQPAYDLRLTASRLTDVGMDGVVLSGALLAECELERVDAADLDMVDARLRDVVVTGARIGGLQAHGAELTRVVFRGSRLGYLNLRSATLSDVVFEGCAIADLDVADATLRRVAIRDCTVERLSCQHADMDDVDLTGARIGAVTDVAHLRGAAFSTAQLTMLAPLLADHVGITVRDA